MPRPSWHGLHALARAKLHAMLRDHGTASAATAIVVHVTMCIRAAGITDNHRQHACCLQVVLARAHNVQEIQQSVTAKSNELANRGLRSLGIARALGDVTDGRLPPPHSGIERNF